MQAVETIEALVARLRARRRDLGLSQVALAERLNVTKSVLCRWETAREMPPMGRYIQWARALGMDLDVSQSGNALSGADG